MRRPSPGRLKTVSTMTAPARRFPNCRPKIVMTGMSAFLSAWRTTTLPPREALGPRGAHVVLAEHLEHARPGEPRDDRRGDGAERHGGHDEVGEVAAAGGGEPAEMEREDEDEEETEPEARHRHAEQRHHHRADVEPRVPAERRHEAEGNAEATATSTAARASWAVLPTFSAISAATGRRLRIEVPRSPAERVADEAPVLHEDRLVEVELGAHAGDLIGIGHELGEHHLDGVAGDEEQHAEDGERDPEEHRHHGEEAPRDPGQHGGEQPSDGSSRRSGPGTR